MNANFSTKCTSSSQRFQHCSPKHLEIKSELENKCRQPKCYSTEANTKQISAELRRLKDQYVRARDRYQQEQHEHSMKYSRLQRELRKEQRRIEELSQRLTALQRASNEIISSKSANDPLQARNAVEQIWDLMQTYRDKIHSEPTTKI